ncbi:Trm112 family protein [Verrucomicrobiota bacterium]
MTEIGKDLMDILACPKCKKPVTQEAETIRCTNEECGLVYPIRDGIPVMLIEEAKKP